MLRATSLPLWHYFFYFGSYRRLYRSARPAFDSKRRIYFLLLRLGASAFPYMNGFAVFYLVPMCHMGTHSGCAASRSSRFYPSFATACNAGREGFPCGAWEPGPCLSSDFLNRPGNFVQNRNGEWHIFLLAS
jgi:hypothetical protein